MKKQSIWVFQWRKSVHYWWSYILFSPECKELTSMLDPLLYRWGVPPVVIRCVHWTMQMWVLQTWIKALGLYIVMGDPTLSPFHVYITSFSHTDTLPVSFIHSSIDSQSHSLFLFSNPLTVSYISTIYNIDSIFTFAQGSTQLSSLSPILHPTLWIIVDEWCVSEVSQGVGQ